MHAYKRWLAALVLLIGASSPLHAAPPEMSAADLASFLDGYLPIEMDRADIAGATVAVVKDGKVIFARGYGYADRAKKTPVSADHTLFRIGSTSKLMLWTAVMQLVEAGKIDLDADVQNYLDFPLRPAVGKAVTMRHLMTHRAGFEETLHELWAMPGQAMDLRSYLVRNLPAQIYAPGTITAYSNYGATLAGYIVERRAGVPFDAYIAGHILAPLGMARTTFAQPLPAPLEPLMSRGYENGSDPARQFEMIRVAPAGSASATASDMARFMIAHLEGGAIDGQRILQPATVQTMHAVQWRHHESGPGMALGFVEDGGYGQRVIQHGGDTQWFHTGLFLVPEQHVGVFYSQNSVGSRVLRNQLFRRLMDRYYPAASTIASAPANLDAQQISGSYLTSRRSESSPVAMMALLGQTKVSVGSDGTLVTSRSQGLNGKTVHFAARGAGIWQDRDDAARKLFFKKGSDGRWEMSGTVIYDVEQKARWYQTSTLISILLGGALAVCALTLLAWPVAALARRHYGARHATAGRQAAAARLASLLTLLPWILLAASIAAALGDLETMAAPGFVLALRATQCAAWVMVAGVVLAAWAVWRSWRTTGTWWWRRTHYLLVLLAGLAAICVAWQANLFFWTGNF